MKITITVPALANEIIERSTNYAEELGRKFNKKDKQKLVSAIVNEMFNDENNSFYQDTDRFDEWVSADGDTQDIFTTLVKRYSTKTKSQ